MSKSLEKMQKEVDEWAHCNNGRRIGEVSRVVNIMYGDKNKKDTEQIKNLEEQLGCIIKKLPFIFFLSYNEYI